MKVGYKAGYVRGHDSFGVQDTSGDETCSEESENERGLEIESCGLKN